jgi:GH24 family phage-related lysozyme (muramidase)
VPIQSPFLSEEVTMQDSVAQAFFTFSTQFEGRVEYMYVDVKDLVTVGIGDLIDPIGIALQLPFVFKTDQSPATPDDITADWNTVKTTPGLPQQGHLACAPLTKLMLTDDSINALVQQKATANESTLKQTTEFSGYDLWPADAQLALLSMAWAMGPAFAQSGNWPSLRTDVAAADWQSAANDAKMAEAANPGLIPRNVADAVLFRNAAFALDPNNNLDATTLQYIPAGERATVQLNSSGADVTYLQGRLATLQYPGVPSSGAFDAATDTAVRSFQADAGLTPDGVVGPATWAATGTVIPAANP